MPSKKQLETQLHRRERVKRICTKHKIDKQLFIDDDALDALFDEQIVSMLKKREKPIEFWGIRECEHEFRCEETEDSFYIVIVV